MKNILLMTTGGTIASAPGKNGLSPAGRNILDYISSDSADSVSESLSENESLSVNKTFQNCKVDELSLFSLDSTDIRPSHWLKLSETIRSYYDQYDGFVITHGTDTLAYTAAGLSVLIENSFKPVVLTGSQIPACMEGSDAPGNLRDALTYVLSDEAFGVHVVFAGHVIDGMCVRKFRTNSVESMISINKPDDACFENGTLKIFVSRRQINDAADACNPNDACDVYHSKTVFHDQINENICILKLYPGIKKDILEYVYSHYDGIVLETFGCGGIPDYTMFEEIVQNAKRTIPVVICTQVMYEGTDLARYEVGRRLLKLPGVTEAHMQTPEAAFAKLAVGK